MTPREIAISELDLHPASPRPIPLRAGPFTLQYEAGDLRYIALGEREVIRRIYVAVRDRNWGTVPARRVDERLEVREDSFHITYLAEHIQGEIDFRWQAEIVGEPDGTIRFRMDGRAHSTFLRNRVGFCVLHPIRECAGTACHVELADGTAAEGRFPREIAPAAPFRELRAISHEVGPGLRAELRMDGDIFEMEDQRNWLDGSLKTFCTPLRLPFPVEVAEGTHIEQAIALTLRGRAPSLPPRTTRLVFSQYDQLAGPLPALGLARASHGEPLAVEEIDRLRLLNLAHLRADFRLKEGGLADRLREAAIEARALGIPLEAAVFVSDDAESDLDRLVDALAATRPDVCRWLIFHEAEWSTSARTIALARRALARHEPSIPIVSGTNANFAELNRGRPPVDRLDGACFAAHPQEHASDDRSLVEALPIFGDALKSARAFCGPLPLTISPITLRRRVNPYATGPARPPGPGELPPRVDPRQMSLFGAGWTIGSLKYAADAGTASLTYYETTGWLGVMETRRGSPMPDRFPSIPGAVFPIFHALADIGEFAGGQAARSSPSDPLRLAGLVLRKDGAARALIANLTDEPQDVAVVGIGDRVQVKTLDGANVGRAMTDPEGFRAEPGESARTVGNELPIRLSPFALARIDWP